MAKFKGKDLSLTIDSVETNIEATSVVLENEEGDSDVLTFAEIGSGEGLQWFFTINAVSDYGSGSFWSTCWDNEGEEVPYLFKPYGNETASPTQPHFSGSCKVAAPPPIGGTANETFTFEVRFDCTSKPERVTA